MTHVGAGKRIPTTPSPLLPLRSGDLSTAAGCTTGSPRLLVHLQDRLCGMSYGSRHETSNLRTFVVARGARGSHRRATLQRCFRPAPKPDTSGKFSWRVPAQDRCEFGMRLPDGAQ